MCDSVFDSYCPSCSKREVCWGSEYSDTLGVINRLTADLHTKARAEESSVPEYLKERCAVMPRMISQINESCARLTEQALLCDRTGVFAANYEGISQILAEALEMGKNDCVADEGAGTALAEQLKKQRIGFDGVLVYGGRRRSVAIKGLDTSRARVGANDLRRIISDAVGARLGELKLVPSAHLMDLTASAERRFSASRCYFSLPSSAEGEGAVCGDTVCEFSTPADRYYSILSDGMGSGKEAALTSRVCSVFLEKMLVAGNRCETSMKLLNSFMSEHDGRSRSEYSVGLDVMELDLLTGELSLIKSGAVPTYIKRGGNCFKLGAKTMPLGIMDEPDMQRLRFNAESGDTVVMVSDGVTRGREDCVWLLSMLTSEWSDGPEAMARMIAERAREEGSDDDITVSIVQIK